MANIDHIGLIPDGNRRWAIKNNMGYYDAYMITMNNLIDFIEITFNNDIKHLSIYLLSKENLERKREDLDAVMKAEIKFVKEMIPGITQKYNARIVHAGKLDLLPEEMRQALTDVCMHTAQNDQFIIYLLVGYNPIDELNCFLDKDNKKMLDIDTLWVNKRVDIVIRTAGGPTLLSNFLPIQCGYAQIYMKDEYFNDFKSSDYCAIIQTAKGIIMPYGK